MTGRLAFSNRASLASVGKWSLYISWSLAVALGLIVTSRLLMLIAEQNVVETAGRLWHDSQLLASALRTFGIATALLTIQMGLALTLVRVLGHISLTTKAALLLPALLSPVSASIAWSLFLSPVLGPANYLIERVGLTAPAWFAQPTAMFMTLALVDSWQWLPFMTVVLLLRFERVSPPLIEQAQLEGASTSEIWNKLLVPSARGTIVALALFRFLELSRIFDAPVVLFGSGGPGGSMESLSMLLYKLTFQRGNEAYAALISVCYLGLVCLVLWRASRSKLVRALVP